MEQRLSLVTLAVEDVDRAREFYVDGLGWSAVIEEPGEVVMIRVGAHVILSLWARAEFEAEVGTTARNGVPPVTLAHNVATRDEVDAVLETARRAGADPVVGGTERVWGGYTGYFADPDGFRWEVAWNPGSIAAIVLPE